MIETPFYNDFYSLILPDNHEEIIEHCLNATELPEESFQWGEVCLSEKVYLKLTGFTELLKPFLLEILNQIIEVPYSYSIEEIWKNTYHRNYHQEQHDHRGYELSFVIFMQDYKENDETERMLKEEITVVCEDGENITGYVSHWVRGPAAATNQRDWFIVQPGKYPTYCHKKMVVEDL